MQGMQQSPEGGASQVSDGVHHRLACWSLWTRTHSLTGRHTVIVRVAHHACVASSSPTQGLHWRVCPWRVWQPSNAPGFNGDTRLVRWGKWGTCVSDHVVGF